MVHSPLLLVRPIAGIAALLLLACGPVQRPVRRPEHRDAPLACQLIALPGNSFTFVGIPRDIRRDFLTGPPTATFQVTYSGFGGSPAAQSAFQAAVDIWAHLVVSAVPIKVRAEFTPLAGNVLGSARSQLLWRDFAGAPFGGTWYVDALADGLFGSDVNAGEPAAFDILASFNSTFSNWYFGTDGATPANQYDFLTVAVHELTHGLGFTGSANVSGALGSIGFAGFPSSYDRFVVTEAGAPLLGFPNPSVALGTQLTSGYNPFNPRGPGSYWGGAGGRAGNGGLSARLYTPNLWAPGSSYSHLDEDTYPAGNVNSLMTFGIAQAEAIHDPGPVTLGLFTDSGWAIAAPSFLPGAFSKTNPGQSTTVQPAGVSLAWTPSSGAGSYEYCVDATLNGACDTGWISAGAATSVGLSNLSPGTTYQWQVRAQNLAGTTQSDGGIWWSFSTIGPPGLFGKSSPIAGAINQPTTLTLQWLTSSTATTYEYCFDTLNNNSCDGAWISAGSSLSASIGALGIGSIYYWQVRARNGTGVVEADSGTWWSFIIVPPGSFAKATPATGATSLPGVKLRWGTSSNSMLYQYCIDTSNNNTCNSSWISADMATSVSVALLPGKTYYWQVRALAGSLATEADSGAWWSFTTRVSGRITDLNGDGIADILLQHSGVTWVAGWLVNGAGQIDQFVPIYFGDIGGWRVVGAADINLDGVTDILLQHSTVTSVAAWLMTPRGQIDRFVPLSETDIGGWRVVGTADLNSDGITDILLQDRTTTWVAAWLMNGAGEIASFVPVYFGDVGNWRIVGAVDLNGDGISDIVMQHSTLTWVAAWLMDGSGRPTGFVPVYSGDTGQWRVVGFLDLNRDGIDDILLQRSGTTWVAAWLMDGVGHPATFVELVIADNGLWRVNGK